MVGNGRRRLGYPGDRRLLRCFRVPGGAPYSAQEQDLTVGLTGPTSSHLLGPDAVGRDVLSGLIIGTRSALVGAMVVAVMSMIIGGTLGLASGYLGGVVDSTIMRWADLMYALPGLLVAIVVVGVLGGGYYRAVALLTVLFAPFDARIIRAATLSRERDHMLRQRGHWVCRPGELCLGTSRPNLFPMIMSKCALSFALALVNLSALSYLGLGAGPESADWGRMLSDSRATLFENPATAVAPAVALVITAASINLLGDWIYERLSDRGRAR